MGSPCWGKVLEGPVDMWREKPTPTRRFTGWTCGGESTLEQPEGLLLMEGTHAGTAHEELQPRGSTQVGEVCRGLSPAGETPYRSRGKV